MECPRCETILSDQEYEGEAIRFCDLCWGYWLTREQLDNIVNTVEYQFSKKEKDEVIQQMKEKGDVDRQGSEGQLINCPECGDVMGKKKYHSKCPIMIDECEAHGIWLDTGEIKDLQVYVENIRTFLA